MSCCFPLKKSKLKKESLVENDEELNDDVSAIDTDNKKNDKQVEETKIQPPTTTIQTIINNNNNNNANKRSGDSIRESNMGEDDLQNQNTFFNFAKERYASDVTNLYDNIMQYKRHVQKKDILAAREKAVFIVNEFIRQDSPQWVDLGDSVNAKLVTALKANQFKKNAFDEARAVVLKLMDNLKTEAHQSLSGEKKKAVDQYVAKQMKIYLKRESNAGSALLQVFSSITPTGKTNKAFFEDGKETDQDIRGSTQSNS